MESCIVTDARPALAEARARARRRVAELAGVFDEIVAASDSANLDDEHDPEGATVAFERTQVATLLEQARCRLAELDDAAGRLQRGVYGVCEQCGEPIAPARLAAQPAARRCIDCASG